MAVFLAHLFRVGNIKIITPCRTRIGTAEERSLHQFGQHGLVTFASGCDRAVFVVRNAEVLFRDVVNHDVAGAAVECKHLTAILVDLMHIGDAADVERHGRLAVAEQAVVHILHQWSALAAEGMVRRSELGDGGDVCIICHDAAIAEAEAVGIDVVEEEIDEVVFILLIRHGICLFTVCLVQVDLLAIDTDAGNLICCVASLLQELFDADTEKCTDCVVQL